MMNVPRNPTVPLPIDVPLYTGLTPMVGEAANLSCTVMCIDNGYQLDSDNTFKQNPISPNFAMTPAFAAFQNVYRTVFQPYGWPRGHYRALSHHTSGLDFAREFSIGIDVVRRLGFSMIYSATNNFRMSVWVEENGDVQSDYTSLTGISIMDMGGNTVATMDDNDSPLNAVFSFDEIVTLTANTHYMLTCTANSPGPAGFSTYSFPLMIGIARP
jgi:hypothetical protein